MTILSMLAAFLGVMSSAAMFPQVYKIFKRRSAKDISFFSYAFFFITGIIWILYGLEIQDIPILISQLVGSIALVFILIGWFLYGR